MEKITLSIADDFSEYPALRHCDISDNSGEQFYHEKLNEAFYNAYTKSKTLVVNLDNTDGYASSFLDEAFGNLVYDFTLDVVKKSVEIVSLQEPHWKDMIETETYLQWENRRQKKDPVKVTEHHPEWYRLVNGKIVKNKWLSPAVK